MIQTAAAQEFTHDEAEHRYWLGQRRVISITDVLKDQGFSDYDFLKPHDSEFYRTRGKYVAKACMLYSAGTLDWDTLKAEVDFSWEYRSESFVEKRVWTLPFVESYAAAAQTYRIKPKIVEQAFHDSIYDYAGKPDLFAECDWGLCDLQMKCGAVEDWVALQTAAELRLLEVNEQVKPGAATRYGLELFKDGKRAKPRPFEDRSDIRIFLGVLAGAKWKRNHGIRKWE